MQGLNMNNIIKPINGPRMGKNKECHDHNCPKRAKHDSWLSG